ncbi:hypothetical protein PENTCL1PPCAC_2943, partial [Pristionchus entomophagus]
GHSPLFFVLFALFFFIQSASTLTVECSSNEACLLFRFPNPDKYEFFTGSQTDVIKSKILRFSISPIDDWKWNLDIRINFYEQVKFKIYDRLFFTISNKTATMSYIGLRKGPKQERSKVKSE